MVEIVYPDTREYDVLLNDISERPISFLCGSAISIFEPTSLQSGASVTWALAEALAAEAGVGGAFRDLIFSSAFEVLLQAYPRQSALNDILEYYFKNSGRDLVAASIMPNNVHKAIAKLLIEKKITNVITTNYDIGIERAVADLGTRIPVPIVGKFEQGSRHCGKVFKVHGSADRQGTIVYSMLQEQAWPRWKSKRLKKLTGRRMMVAGYSGLDFEICPELYAIDFDFIVWVALPDRNSPHIPELKPNAIKVLEKYDNAYVFCGDMRKILTDLSQFDCLNCKPAEKPINISEILLNSLSPTERRLWAAKVFVELGVPVPILNVLSTQSALGPLPHEFRLLRPAALNQSGRYWDAAEENSDLASDISIPLKLRAGHKVGESGSASMGGFEIRSEQALHEAEALAARIADPHERAESQTGIEWMLLVLARGKVDRTNAADVAALVARLRLLYQRAIDGGRYDLAALCSNEIKELSGENTRALSAKKFERSARELFGQIGNFVGQVTAERDAARRSMAQRDATILKSRLADLESFGLFPELWRVIYTLIHFEPDASERSNLFDRFEYFLNQCQFEQSYVEEMMTAGRAAVASPKGIKLHG